jgi:AcrR family transcriptional regulator
LENERKTQILKAAAKRFARHGLNKTTLNEIARDLRIGKATLYHYFPSKEELFYQTQEYDVSLFLEDIRKILGNNQKPLKEKINEYLLYKEDIYNKYKLLFDLISRHLQEDIPERETGILKAFFTAEEEIIHKVFNSSFGSDAAIPELAYVIVMQSWGVLFANKFNMIVNPDKPSKIRETVYKNFANLLDVK